MSREQTVQPLAIVDVILAIEKDPICRPEQLLRNINHARLDVSGGVEDLAGHVASGGDNNEPGVPVSTDTLGMATVEERTHL